MSDLTVSGCEITGENRNFIAAIDACGHQAAKLAAAIRALMEYGWKALAISIVMALGSPHSANASTIQGIFGGKVDSVVNISSNPLKGQISVGDLFLGGFAYDSITGTPSYFSAALDGNVFVAHNLSINALVYDGFLTFFAVRGQLDNGLFMSVGLTNGSTVFTSLPPQSLNSDDWQIAAFRIDSLDVAAIESGAGQPAFVRGSYGKPRSPNDFFLFTTVPEPSVELLLALGLLGLAIVRWIPKHGFLRFRSM